MTTSNPLLWMSYTMRYGPTLIRHVCVDPLEAAVERKSALVISYDVAT